MKKTRISNGLEIFYRKMALMKNLGIWVKERKVAKKAYKKALKTGKIKIKKK